MPTRRARPLRLALLLVGGAACTQSAPPTDESTRAGEGRSADAAPATSPDVDVVILDPGREPRAVLALRPPDGAEEEVELAYRLHEREGGPPRGELRVLVNVRSDRVQEGRIHGELLVGSLISGSPPCPQPPATPPSEPDQGTLKGPIAMLALAGSSCTPSPVGGPVRVSARGVVEEVTLGPGPTGPGLPSVGSPPLELVLPLPLPAEPVGAGARWRARRKGAEAGIEAMTETVCELVSFDGQRGSLKAHIETTSPGGPIDHPGLGKATLRDVVLRVDREAELDLSRLTWSSSATMSLLATIESEGAPVRDRYDLTVSVASPGADYIGLLRRVPPPGVAAARSAAALCRTLRGARNGDASTAYPDGGKRLSGTCRDGAPEGAWTWWHPDGSAELEGAFTDGKPDGVWRQRAASGRRLGEYRFAEGTGQAVLWAADGTRQAAVGFRDGVPDGERTAWDDKGRVVRREIRDPRCLVVAEAAPSSPAGRAGIRPGDQIDAVNGSRVESAAALREAVQAASTRPVVVGIRRAGRGRSVRVTPALDEGQARIGTRLACCHALLPAGAACAPE